MWRHVSDAALMDVVEGGADDRALAHVVRCGRCRVRVDEARSALALAAGVEVPEPMPLYWEAMRRQVARGALEAEQPRTRRPLWAAAALAGAAAVAFAIVAPLRTVPEPTPAAPPSVTLPAWSALPPSEEDADLDVLETVVPAAVAAAPSLECSGAAECVAFLDDEEKGALAEVLREALEEGTL